MDPEVPEGGGDLPVVFRLRPGPRHLVESVDVQAASSLPADAPSRELHLRPGSPYRLRDLARDRNTLLAAYRDAGYPHGGGDARGRRTARTGRRGSSSASTPGRRCAWTTW